MANPFLFGAPAAGGMPPQQPMVQPDNPFLSGGGGGMMASPQPMAQQPGMVAANPFLTGAQPRPQVQMGMGGPFGQPTPPPPPPAGVSANPFASFGAPAAAAAAPSAAATGAALFCTPTPPAAAPTPPMSQFTTTPSTTMTQFTGSHGDYVQVTAGQHAEPVVCTASTGVPANENPFGVPSKTTPIEGADVGELTPVTNATNGTPQPTAVVTETRASAVVSPPTEAEPAEAEKTEVIDDVPLPSPPPPEEEEKLAPGEPADLTSPEEAVEEEEQLPPPPPSEPEVPEGIADETEVGAEPSPDPGQEGNSTGASLFGVDPSEVPSLPKEEDKPAIREDSPPKSPSPPPPEPVKISTGDAIFDDQPKMSTGDAIFADLPAADLKSTGANIFGTSEESAANTTGATLYEVGGVAQALQPALGAMSGWDDAFDRKFDSGGTTRSADAFDAFGASGAAMFVAPAATAGFGGGDAFGSGKFDPNAPSAKLEADLNNPFLNEAKKNKATEDGEEVLFDDDTSKPLEPFPRVGAKSDGWEFYIRHPPKKKGLSMSGAQRYWKKVFVRIIMQGDNPCIALYENKEAKETFQEIPLQYSYSLSDISHQVFDQYSKIFTLKVQFVSYKERAGIRPGQISKLEKLTGKIGRLAKAVEDADLKGVKEFGSDMKKLGMPLEHAAQVSELLKLGGDNYENMKQFSVTVEEKLFRMSAHRDRALTYKTEEVQLTAVDEVYVEQDKSGHVVKELCRVRVFFLSFLSEMPDIELGVNDLTRMGLEVVGRHDILQCPTDQWIRYEDIQFHPIIDRKAFEKNDHIISFKPPDATYLELMRFRTRPPKARELPMQARCTFQTSGNKVEIKADMMIPYPFTKAWGQVPCEDVAMRIPLPEAWVYLFRSEKAHISLSQLASGNLNIGSRLGAVKSAHRRAGKVKGLERVLGTLESQKQELMEATSGEAKYEHQHKAIVWRVPRLPKHGQGSYTNHEFVCKLQLTGYDQMPEKFDKNFYVEFTQPACATSHTVLRSVSIQPQPDEPPEKCVKYIARHEYKLEIDYCDKEESSYKVAAAKKEPQPEEEEEKERVYEDFPDENGERKFDSDSDSD